MPYSTVACSLALAGEILSLGEIWLVVSDRADRVRGRDLVVPGEGVVMVA